MILWLSVPPSLIAFLWMSLLLLRSPRHLFLPALMQLLRLFPPWNLHKHITKCRQVTSLLFSLFFSCGILLSNIYCFQHKNIRPGSQATFLHHTTLAVVDKILICLLTGLPFFQHPYTICDLCKNSCSNQYSISAIRTMWIHTCIKTQNHD